MLSARFVSRFAALVSAAIVAGSLAASCTTVSVVSRCEADLAECEGLCVDLANDGLHCGKCQNACDSQAACVDGFCVPVIACEPPLAECAGGCADLHADTNNCGDCDNTCPDGSQCIGGECTGTPACDEPLCGLLCSWTSLPPATAFSVGGDNSSGDASLYQPTCVQVEAPESAFVFVAPESGIYSFDTLGSWIDTVLEVRNGACEVIACDDDSFEDKESLVLVALVAGEATTIVVDGFDPGTFHLNGEFLGVCPPGLTQCGSQCVDTLSEPEHCGGCFMTCEQGCWEGDCVFSCLVNSCGTCGGEVDLGSAAPQIFNGLLPNLQDGFTPSCADSSGTEIAHLFVAPTTASYTFTTVAGFFPTLSVLDESCGALACSTSEPSPVATLDVVLSAGEAVIIVIDSSGGGFGEYSLEVSAPF